jgi:group I intron endonuclease
MKAGIYLITSPSGRKYVGQAVDLERRMNNYKGLRCKYQTYLFNSLKKHSFEQHKVKFLFECNFADFERETLKDLLNDLETEFILAYKTFNDHDPKGMNLTTGGGVCVVSEQTKAKISEFQNRPEVKAKNSEARKGNKNMLGKIHSAEAKVKMSEASKGKIHSEKTKAKMSESKQNMTAETKAKMSEFQKEYCNRPEVKAKMSESKKGDNNPLRKRNLKRYNDRLAYAKSRKDLNEPLNIARIVGVQVGIFGI